MEVGVDRGEKRGQSAGITGAADTADPRRLPRK